VADTGIGIALEDRDRIFEEFGQVEGPLQARVKGTGLGLPLSRKLAELLGGNVSVKSEPGVGSTFFAVVPRLFHDPVEQSATPSAPWQLDPNRLPLLVVENDPVDLLLYEKMLHDSEFQVLPARTLAEARRALRRVKPVAVLLDILLEVESGWHLLTEMKAQEATRDVPVLVLTVVDGEERALALGASAFCLKPIDQAWLLGQLDALATNWLIESVLIIDDSESDRRLLRELLAAGGQYRVVEAGSGEAGLQKVREEPPSVIFLDLVMPDMTGLEVLGRLKQAPGTAGIPVIINTSKQLDDDERKRLSVNAAAILEKSLGTREESFAKIRQALIKAGLDLVSARLEA
jgi:CheY-like chemotaxis protein